MKPHCHFYCNTSWLILAMLTIMLIGSTPLQAQRKIPAESRHDREKRALTDPWAGYEDEIDSIRQWEFGINLGAYFPHKYSAGFYSGAPGNVNNLNYVMSNKYWYQDIKRLMGSNDTVIVDGYPANMHYQAGFTGGLFLRYNFNRKNGLLLEANYTWYTASDYITYWVDPQYYITLQDIRPEPVVGKEARVLLDLGYQRSFPFKSRLYLFLQAGGIMSYTQVQKSYVLIEGTEFSMINIYGDQVYVPNTDIQTQNIYQNAFGFGGFLGAGAGIPLNDNFGLEPGFSMQYYPTNLTGYQGFRPNWSVYLRILLGFD